MIWTTYIRPSGEEVELIKVYGKEKKFPLFVVKRLKDGTEFDVYKSELRADDTGNKLIEIALK